MQKKTACILAKHSTTNALVRASHTWLTETDSKQPIMVLVLLADMSKASGRVDHADLLQHLASLCLCPGLLTWFHSCTTGRTQRVIANGMYSSWPEVISDTGYANDIGLFCALRLENIENGRGG